jgi:hypothetical protein
LVHAQPSKSGLGELVTQLPPTLLGIFASVSVILPNSRMSSACGDVVSRGGVRLVQAVNRLPAFRAASVSTTTCPVYEGYLDCHPDGTPHRSLYSTAGDPAVSRCVLRPQARMSADGRLCCKSLKTPGDKFPARSRNKPRSLIDVASGSLPKSPVSLSPDDEVPHMFTRKPRLQLEKFAINGAKRLLRHNRHITNYCGAQERAEFAAAFGGCSGS